jgi:acylphosphatase
METTICIRCVVTGRVQGVAYRAATQHRAYALNLTGYAKNLPDGNVEILACGAGRDINALREWLWEGPRLAQVSGIQCSSVTNQDLRGFVTL